MMVRFAANFVATVTFLVTVPLVAAAAPPDGASVNIEIEHNGQRVFAPRLLVRLGQMAEASLESPSGKEHRILLSVARHEASYKLRSLYLTKGVDDRWVVQAEPELALRGDTPATATVADDVGMFRLHLNVRVGNVAELHAQSRIAGTD